MSNRPIPRCGRRARVPWGPGALAGLLLLGIIGGCTFDLADVVTGLPGDGGGGNNGGSAAVGGGGTPGGSGAAANGGVGGSDVTPPCPPDQKLCADGQCRAIAPMFGCGSTACQPCGAADNAVVGCSEAGECIVASCTPGRADCNGLVIDGCEFAFGEISPSPDEMPVPFANIVLDGEIGDWANIPSYPYQAVCRDCLDNATARITEDGTVPPRDDLESYFRVAWNNDFFFVVQDTFDRDLLDDSALVPSCQDHGGARALCEDGLQVFLDGREDRREGYFNDNIRVLVGLSERFFAPTMGDVNSDDVTVKALKWAPACYRIEARFDWEYVTNSAQGNPAPPGQFPPLPGQIYGFDIAVNDWDPSIADATLFERQSQVFWLDAGSNYATTTAGLPLMKLVGGSDAGAP